MKINKLHFYLLLYLVAILSACTLTTTKAKTVEITDETKFEREFKPLVTAESVNFNGKEIIKNNQTSNKITVSVINAKTLPQTSDDQKALAKTMATCVRKYLKNSNDYDAYKIQFVAKTERTGMKVEKSIDFTFKASEL